MTPTCCVHACQCPVRAYGGYCWHHWQGFSPLQRAAIQGEATEPVDPLERIYRLPAYGEQAA